MKHRKIARTWGMENNIMENKILDKLIERFYRTQIELYGYIRYGVRKWNLYNEPTVYKIDVYTNYMLLIKTRDEEFNLSEMIKELRKRIDRMEQLIVTEGGYIELTAREKEKIYKEFADAIRLTYRDRF